MTKIFAGCLLNRGRKKGGGGEGSDSGVTTQRKPD